MTMVPLTVPFIAHAHKVNITTCLCCAMWVVTTHFTRFLAQLFGITSYFSFGKFFALILVLVISA